ncbi:MAG: hypothetical protein M3N29_03610 [Chloroflexota bacterium]|nr:hypothetical protein [Chloroflexota bacterium]
MYHDQRTEWQMYAFHPAEKAVMGRPKRESTAVAQTEEGVIREMARCLVAPRLIECDDCRRESKPQRSEPRA